METYQSLGQQQTESRLEPRYCDRAGPAIMGLEVRAMPACHFCRQEERGGIVYATGSGVLPVCWDCWRLHRITTAPVREAVFPLAPTVYDYPPLVSRHLGRVWYEGHPFDASCLYEQPRRELGAPTIPFLLTAVIHLSDRAIAAATLHISVDSSRPRAALRPSLPASRSGVVLCECQSEILLSRLWEVGEELVARDSRIRYLLALDTPALTGTGLRAFLLQRGYRGYKAQRPDLRRDLRLFPVAPWLPDGR